MATNREILEQATESDHERESDANSQSSLVPLYKEIQRRESRINLTSLLTELKDSENRCFVFLVEKLQGLDGKPKRQYKEGITMMLESLDKSRTHDHFFMYLIEATFTVDYSNGDKQNYGRCLKLLDKRQSDFMFHDPECVRLWLARHKCLYYMSKNKPMQTEPMKGSTKVLLQFYKSDSYKPDMWKAFASQQLYKLNLYEHYHNMSMTTSKAEDRENDDGDVTGTSTNLSSYVDVLSLLDDECTFAECDPDHCKYPYNYDFLWPHVQKCIVILRIPVAFHMQFWINRSLTGSQMRYVNFPEHFKRYFETSISRCDIDDCEKYFKQLKQIASSAYVQRDVDQYFLTRMINVISIGIAVRKFTIESNGPEFVPILLMMIEFIEGFLVTEPFYLRGYTYARPETIFPVFLCFLQTLVNGIKGKVQPGQPLKLIISKAFQLPVTDKTISHFVRFQSVLSDSCELHFTDKNLSQFCENLKGFTCDLRVNMRPKSDCSSATNSDNSDSITDLGVHRKSLSHASDCI